MTKLGSEGVGVAYYQDKPVLLPGTLPGEQVLAAVTAEGREGRVLTIRRESPERVTPACRHFGVCGGCALQHLADPAYRQFKRALVTEALRRQGMREIDVAPVMVSPAESRRRASFEAVRQGTRVILGFHERASHTLVDVHDCPVLAPSLLRLLAPLRRFLAMFLRPGDRAAIVLTLLDTGVDLGMALPQAPDLSGLEALSTFAETEDLARLWWRCGDMAPVPAAIRREPVVRFGGSRVVVPMGGFLQATVAGEEALTALVTAALACIGRVADLFAGAGTFTLPLAVAGASVHAVEGDASALAALAGAARVARLNGVTSEQRDLEARPLLASELKRFDAVVFDPPRAGARAQAQILATADVTRIVAVSCNPATFARDATILSAGGWRLERVTPVDQFLWSPHVELVGTFSRAP